MLSPELIERIKREREEQDRPALRLPLPEEPCRKIEVDEDEEKTNRIVIIDLI